MLPLHLGFTTYLCLPPGYAQEKKRRDSRTEKGWLLSFLEFMLFKRWLKPEPCMDLISYSCCWLSHYHFIQCLGSYIYKFLVLQCFDVDHLLMVLAKIELPKKETAVVWNWQGVNLQDTTLQLYQSIKRRQWFQCLLNWCEYTNQSIYEHTIILLLTIPQLQRASTIKHHTAIVSYRYITGKYIPVIQQSI